MSTPGFDLSKLPAAPPPAGVVPNFTNHKHNRYTTLDEIDADLIFTAEKAGAGRHQWNLPASEVAKDSFLIPLYILLNLVPVTSLFAKLSFYIFYLQVFDVKLTLKWFIYLGAMVATVFYIATTVATFVLSTPTPGRPFYWQFMTTARKFFKLALVIGYFNIASDLYILLLPISGVIRLQLPIRRKVGVILIFMTGSLACIASSVALFYRYRMSDSGDSTWNLLSATYTTQVELTIGMACSCMPACAKLVRHHLPQFPRLKSYLSSRVRVFSFRHGSSSQGSLGNRRFFSLGPSKSFLDHQQPGLDGEEVVTMGKLPKIHTGMYHMRTARSFIWGGRKHHTTIAALDEEEDGIYYHRDFQRPVKKA